MLVHIIEPNGTRHERAFPDGASSESILAQLRHPAVARQFGRSAYVMKKDSAFGKDVPHADHESPWVVEHPDTVIVIGRDNGVGEFVEEKRIAGPPAKEAKAEEFRENKKAPPKE